MLFSPPCSTAILVCAECNIDRLTRSNTRLSRDNSALRVQSKEFHAKVNRLVAVAKEHEETLASQATAFDLLDREVSRLKEREAFLLEELMKVGRVTKGKFSSSFPLCLNGSAGFVFYFLF